jgi:hypothetical protein
MLSERDSAFTKLQKQYSETKPHYDKLVQEQTKWNRMSNTITHNTITYTAYLSYPTPPNVQNCRNGDMI